MESVPAEHWKGLQSVTLHPRVSIDQASYIST